jgi:hypothetical protein
MRSRQMKNVDFMFSFSDWSVLEKICFEQSIRLFLAAFLVVKSELF